MSFVFLPGVELQIDSFGPNRLNPEDIKPIRDILQYYAKNRLTNDPSCYTEKGAPLSHPTKRDFIDSFDHILWQTIKVPNIDFYKSENMLKLVKDYFNFIYYITTEIDEIEITIKKIINKQDWNEEEYERAEKFLHIYNRIFYKLGHTCFRQLNFPEMKRNIDDYYKNYYQSIMDICEYHVEKLNDFLSQHKN